jgi:hypothetical protein
LKRSMGETSEAIECLRGGAGGRARARARQLPPRLRRDADRARTASPSNQIWNGKGYGQRPVDFSGVLRRCCLVRERTSRVAPTGLEGPIIRLVGYPPTVGGAPGNPKLSGQIIRSDRNTDSGGHHATSSQGFSSHAPTPQIQRPSPRHHQRTLTPSPNPDPVLVRESSRPWRGWKGFSDEEATQCRADRGPASAG